MHACVCSYIIVSGDHFRYHIWMLRWRFIFFWICISPYSRASAVGGQPGT